MAHRVAGRIETARGNVQMERPRFDSRRKAHEFCRITMRCRG